jgi:hypothetical protein
MIRTLDIDVDHTTWPRGLTIPLAFSRAPHVHQINLASAFLMLGTLTMPDLLSPASPARLWAWLRYFLAPAPTPDLRITMDFAGLDPHQKGILSDDFGVALTTQWMYDRLGGFANIIDGRRFMVQFAHLMPPKTKPKTAKVGPGKAPDFVIQDLRGKWHVLECKGTQSGPAARDTFLRNAFAQKNTIQIVGALRGERLAAGVALSNEQEKRPSDMRVIDPESDPLITLGDDEAEEMNVAAHRIAVARALGMVGLGEMAIELSLPTERGAADQFLRPGEKRRLRSERVERRARAQRQMNDRTPQIVKFRKQDYESRSIHIADLQREGRSAIREIRVLQGVNRELVREIESLGGSTSDEVIDSRLQNYTNDARVKIETRGSRVTLTYGDVLFATLVLNELRSISG